MARAWKDESFGFDEKRKLGFDDDASEKPSCSSDGTSGTSRINTQSIDFAQPATRNQSTGAIDCGIDRRIIVEEESFPDEHKKDGDGTSSQHSQDSCGGVSDFHVDGTGVDTKPDITKLQSEAVSATENQEVRED